MSCVKVYSKGTPVAFVFNNEREVMYVMTAVFDLYSDDIYMFDVFTEDSYLGACFEYEFSKSRLCIPCEVIKNE